MGSIYRGAFRVHTGQVQDWGNGTPEIKLLKTKHSNIGFNGVATAFSKPKWKGHRATFPRSPAPASRNLETPSTKPLKSRPLVGGGASKRPLSTSVFNNRCVQAAELTIYDGSPFLLVLLLAKTNAQ